MSAQNCIQKTFYKLEASGDQIRLTFVDGLTPPQDLYRSLRSCWRSARGTENYKFARVKQDGDVIVFHLSRAFDKLQPNVRKNLLRFIHKLFDRTASMKPIRQAERAHNRPTTYWAGKFEKTAVQQLFYFHVIFEHYDWCAKGPIYRTLLAHWDEDNRNKALTAYAFELLSK